MKSVVVVPSIRADRIEDWLDKWSKELEKSIIIIIEDNPQKTFKIKRKNVAHYSWEEIDIELGENSWIIPRRTAAIRSFGFYKAYQLKPDMVLTLDDDCYPDDKNFVKIHHKYLNKKYSPSWTQHAQGDFKMRGFPKNIPMQKCILNMGLWSNIPDLDGEAQKENPNFRMKKQDFNFHLGLGQYAPISSMNLAIKPRAIPAFYYLLMGPQWGFDRFDDIWSGIFLKKIADHLGYTISGGNPYIRHDRVSSSDINIEKEKAGKEINEHLWKDVDRLKLVSNNFKSCYIELSQQLPAFSEYWKKLKQAMVIWANLF